MTVLLHTLSAFFRAFPIALALAAAPAAAAGAELRPFDAGSVKAILAANAGRPFVLAFWSIHCAPCLQDMDDWLALQAKYPRVPVILVTTDGPAEREGVLRTIARYRMGRLENWSFADEFAERVRFAIDASWRGELPRTYLYDASHKREVLSGRIDLPQTEAWFARQP